MFMFNRLPDLRVFSAVISAVCAILSFGFRLWQATSSPIPDRAVASGFVLMGMALSSLMTFGWLWWLNKSKSNGDGLLDPKQDVALSAIAQRLFPLDPIGVPDQQTRCLALGAAIHELQGMHDYVVWAVSKTGPAMIFLDEMLFLEHDYTKAACENLAKHARSIYETFEWHNQCHLNREKAEIREFIASVPAGEDKIQAMKDLAGAFKGLAQALSSYGIQRPNVPASTVEVGTLQQYFSTMAAPVQSAVTRLKNANHVCGEEVRKLKGLAAILLRSSKNAN